MIVLDASAWVDILVGASQPPSPDEEVRVPPHFDVEVIGTLRALVQRDELSLADAETALDRHLRVGFEHEREERDIRQAWRWKDDLSFPDGWYAALALRLGATWVTLDERAAPTARRLGVATSRP